MIRIELKRLCKGLTEERNRVEIELIKKLDEAFRKSIAANVFTARFALDQFLNAKHEDSIARAKS